MQRRSLHDALDRMCVAPAEARAEIEELIWQLCGATGAPLVLDMAGFSRATERQGIVPALCLTRRILAVAAPAIRRRAGNLVKADADNLFALFADVPPAIEAALAINAALAAHRRAEPDLYPEVCIGISYGQLLSVERDYFGGPVNSASKLGEDVAKGGEILLDQAAYERAPVATCEQIQAAPPAWRLVAW